MIHQPSGSASGQATDIQIHAEEILYLKKRLYGIYERHTKQSLELIESFMERDKFMNADQAKDFGLIDTIIERMPTAEKLAQAQDNEKQEAKVTG